MDRDGTRQGFDIALTRAIADAVPVPVIASGGVGTLDHLVEGMRDGHATRRARRLDLPLRRALGARGQGVHGARRPADAARSLSRCCFAQASALFQPVVAPEQFAVGGR